MSDRCIKCGQPLNHNGWCNYETWNMFTILTNSENLDKTSTLLARAGDSDYNGGMNVKAWIEDAFFVVKYDIYHFSNESWTFRDFDEINWYSIGKALREE